MELSNIQWGIAVLTIAALFLGRMVWVGIRNKSIRNFQGTHTSQEVPSYYLQISIYGLAAILLAALAVLLVHQEFGPLYSVGLALALFPLLWLWVHLWDLPSYLLKGIIRVFNLKISLPKLPSKKSVEQLTEVEEEQPADSPVTEEEPAPFTVEDWFQAADALISHATGQPHSSLFPHNSGPISWIAARRHFRREWEVKSKRDFQEIQDWLFQIGHRREFHEQMEFIMNMDTQELQQYLEDVDAGKFGLDTLQEQAEEKHRVEMVRTNQDGIRYQSFLAWDYLRYIHNYKLGVAAGFASEDEALNRMRSAGQVLQNRYGSWAELGKNYLDARQFWSSVEMEKGGEKWWKAYHSLTKDPASIWNQSPWPFRLIEIEEQAE
ncbi:DUF1266 domain-containing protein [Pontibacter sp. G13]|uniref:DUF1266 domain-containing protein n=1 Tax=Pontibacter sp. G13 TaxID=3074898 RepID=UPI00288B5C77|nr:DUF1266 domain-containing protein [Pontibacter sp. G13]WNJ15957.1 DUF1266 domain-containing protein [Pontibacter sp. G13]